MSAPLCLWYLLVCICVQMMSVSCHEPWTNILLGLEGRVLNNGFVCFRRDSHYIAVSFIKIELFLFLFFAPHRRNIIAVSERQADGSPASHRRPAVPGHGFRPADDVSGRRGCGLRPPARSRHPVRRPERPLGRAPVRPAAAGEEVSSSVDPERVSLVCFLSF